MSGTSLCTGRAHLDGVWGRVSGTRLCTGRAHFDGVRGSCVRHVYALDMHIFMLFNEAKLSMVIDCEHLY